MGSQHRAMALRAAVSLPAAAARPWDFPAHSAAAPLWVESRKKIPNGIKGASSRPACSAQGGGKSKDEISEATDNSDSLTTKF